MPCPEPECKERIDERIKEHHETLYAPDGLVAQLNAKIEALSVKINELMPKLDWKGWAGVILAISCYLIVAGYSVYSQEFKYATKDTVTKNKETAIEERHHLSERTQALEITVIRIKNDIQTLKEDLSAKVDELSRTVKNDDKDRKKLCDKIDQLINVLNKEGS